MERITLADSGGIIELGKGESFEVSLPLGASSGYEWKLKENNPDILKEVSVRTETPRFKSIGASSKRIFIFQTLNTGEGKLKLLYLRPWKDEVASKVFELTVKVS